MTRKLEGLRIAALAADGFEQVELLSPMKELARHGAEVEVVSLRPGKILGVNGLFPGKKVKVDRTLAAARPEAYDALLLPGGLVNPDLLRQTPEALAFVQAFDAAGKPIATICHGPWLLVSGGLAAGRSLTSWPGIKDDVKNAGGLWEDSAVVRDRNWVSSRGPQDLPKFNKAMVALFAERLHPAGSAPEGAGATGPLRWLALIAGILAILGGLAARRIAARREEDFTPAPTRAV